MAQNPYYSLEDAQQARQSQLDRLAQISAKRSQYGQEMYDGEVADLEKKADEEALNWHLMAGKGAGMGAGFGPIGAIVGGVGGAILGQARALQHRIGKKKEGVGSALFNTLLKDSLNPKYMAKGVMAGGGQIVGGLGKHFAAKKAADKLGGSLPPPPPKGFNFESTQNAPGYRDLQYGQPNRYSFNDSPRLRRPEP